MVIGGSRVNIMLDMTQQDVGLANLEPIPFTIQMAVRWRVQVVAIIRDMILVVATIQFYVIFKIIKMEDIVGASPLLLKRPWLR